MTVVSIHILKPDDNNRLAQAQAALENARIAEHRRGLHPWGSMRRDCPFCQAGK